MSTRTEEAWRMARHPATVTLARCVALCVMAGVQAGLRGRAADSPCQGGKTA